MLDFSHSRWVSSMLLLLVGFGGWAFSNDAAQLDRSRLHEIEWRSIGPAAFGGRIDDVEAVRGDPDVIFVAAASGGIFRSTNNGVTWTPLFDSQGPSISIGDIAIAPSDPAIVWAGSGEPNNRQSSSWGSGIYRSLDGGDSWQPMGLEQTHHIGRVVVHPTDPDTVFAAALGHLWGPNPERGLYRTRDGGQSWEKILFINDDTGVVDVAMEGNGRILYAAAYQRRRRGWGFVGGGPHSGLYRSLDGGDNWEQLKNGLPAGDTGRIGISVSSSHPHIVYAIVENEQGGVFRSQDRGSSWKRVNQLNPRPMYYSQIRVDPVNPDKVWVLGSPLFLSIDGGKTFSSEKTAVGIHVDHHALWIDPDDPDHLMLGNDGGLYFSYDGSKTWDFIDNLPIAQYYAIGLDGRDPYWIYGGTQDNGTWALPSRNNSQLGITNLDVLNVAYGDGFYAAVDPRDHRLVYCESQNGRLYRVDMQTLEEKGIRPVPEDSEEEYRFNWNAPLILSPHDPDVIYYGGNKLFRSRDQGHSWQEVSPDLTRNQDWKKLPIMGVERDDDTLSRDDGTSSFGTLTTISESRLQPGLIWTGSDDGVVQLTRDGGKNWTGLTERFGLPGPRWVSRVLASTHQAGTAYVSFDGHQDDDFRPYIFKTEDFGASWSSISGDLPEGIVINSLAEHHHTPQLLFAGSEFGLYVSVNGGANWMLMKNGLPRVPVDDMIIHQGENDLVLGTHGRGIYVLDDLAFLEAMAAGAEGDHLTLVPLRQATQYYLERALPAPGAAAFSGPNPPQGALISYYLAEDLAAGESSQDHEGDHEGEHDEDGEDDHEDSDEEAQSAPSVRITILDGERVVRELSGPSSAGFHRVAWDLREELSYQPGADEEGWFGPPQGPFVLPGSYTVRISAGEKQRSGNVEVRVDPQAQASPADLEARYQASLKANRLLGTYVRASELRADLAAEIEAIDEKIEGKEGLEKLREEVEKAEERLEEMAEFFASGWRSNRHQLADLLGQLQASTSKPTQAQIRRLDQLNAQVLQKIDQLNALAGEEYPKILNSLSQEGIRLKSFEPIRID